MSEINEYQRETVEFQPVTVTVDSVTVTAGVLLAVVPDGTRPTTFAAASQVAEHIGVMVDGFTPGYWRVFAKLADNPETPVIDCGVFHVN